MGEAVVILAPDGGCDQQVQGGDGGTPGDLVAHGQPLGVLVVHAVDDVDEGLVGGEEAVAPGQQIALVPALQGVLGEHLQDAPIRGQLATIGVLRQIVREPQLLADLIDGVELVRRILVRAEDAEVAHVLAHDLAQHGTQGLGVHGADPTGLVHGAGKGPVVGHAQGTAQLATVGVGVGAHAHPAFGGHGAQFGLELAGGVEQLLGFIAAQPSLELLHVGWVVVQTGERHLMGAPEALDLLAVDVFRTGPALGAAQDDHGPVAAGRLGGALGAGVLLEGADLGVAGIQGRRHLLVHLHRVAALDEVGRPAVAPHQHLQLIVGDACE